MTDDVTIPREDARKWAGALRDAFDQLGGSAPLGLIGLADLLDPPQPSLRDEMADLITTRAVLAVARQRVEALDHHWCVHVGGALVRRADLLALLGGESDD